MLTTLELDEKIADLRRRGMVREPEIINVRPVCLFGERVIHGEWHPSWVLPDDVHQRIWRKAILGEPKGFIVHNNRLWDYVAEFPED